MAGRTSRRIWHVFWSGSPPCPPRLRRTPWSPERAPRRSKRLKELEQENSKLKRLVANLSLEKLVLKGRLSFTKPDVDAALYQIERQLSKIVEVSGQPVHRVTNDRVALTHEAQHGGELWPVRVFAGSLVYE